MKYNPKKIEKKWRKKWEQQGIFKAKDVYKKPKFYCLDMFPYPSGEGLHVGHPRGYIATDIFSHYMRRKGNNVLHPMGWDAFGLPAENYAIKTGIHPEISTKKNIKKFKKQMDSIGLSYDWSREINTTDPDYYKWTQWIFLLLYKRGLAYEAVLPINFCPSCKTGLANEEVIDDRCERCGAKVVKKDLRQWMLKITAYADRLLKDLEGLDWPEKIITMQKNWIGRSEGTKIKFPLVGLNEAIEVFTTRIDTIFSGTFLILAPEHSFINKYKNNIENWNEVEEYQNRARQTAEIERTAKERDWTGIELKGIKAINPATNEEIPIWTADFVMVNYGTGAVFADAHDKRDFYLAKKYGIPLKTSIRTDDEELFEKIKKLEKCYEGEGILFNSQQFNGLKSSEARVKITDWLQKKGLARSDVNYKLRDWIFSRQRYWGEPIPIVHCRKCGIVSLPEKDLPLKLPKVRKYQPTGTGESPLATIKNWVETECPKCGGPAKRETNTMPQWAGSCWYFLRYINPKNNKKIVDPKRAKYWLPVDLYVGGAEHAVLHLLYSRFWIKVLYDEGVINFKEPFLKLRNQGLIMAPDGQKMSKSRGNVISPDDIIKKYGADTFRLYEMFMGPFKDAISWDSKGIEGCYRFLNRVWNLVQNFKNNNKSSGEIKPLIHKTIKKVTEDIENFRFNTAVSALMILANELGNNNKTAKDDIKNLLLILAPFALHITEELWKQLGFSGNIHTQEWPKYNPKLIKEKIITLVIQINSKIRDKIEVNSDISEEEAKEMALSQEKIKKWIGDKEIKKTIFVPNRLINFII